MAIKLADAFVPITGDNSPLKRTLNETRSLITGWARNIVQGIGQGIGQALFNQIQRGIGAGIGLIQTSLSATRDLNESLSKTNVAFGSSAKTILEWSKTSATALIMSRQQALEAASGFGLLFSSMRIGQDEAAGMSMTLVQLAADMASINNITVDEALTALKSGLVGETEPLRRFGVLLSAATVEAEALRTGLAGTAEQITENDKVMARYNIILDQTIQTQGDVARTLQGIANQERELAARRTDALAQLGQAFAPIYQEVLRGLNQLLGQIAPYGDNIVRQLATGMVRGIIWLLPVVRQIRDFFIEWFKPGSPPKMLPDLVKWGMETMQVYLDAFGQADFGVLRDLGGTIEGILRSFVTSGAIGENDIISRVFGTRKAIAAAIVQWRTAGQITNASINAITDAAGPAGFALGGMVRAFFDLEGASRRASQAQDELNRVTEEYNERLDPLNKQLDEINDKQQAIRDRQATSAARRTLRDPAATANEKRLAQLEIEEISIRQQIDTVEEERDVALDAAEKKLKSAQREEQIARAIYDAQLALLDAQTKINQLIGEENDLRKKQEADAERLYQATLAYNLALADTGGKLALMRLELSRTEEGSVEYFNILTQIAGLEKQLSDETEPIVSPEDILPSMDEVDVPGWVKDLQAELRGAIDDILGGGEQLPMGPMPATGFKLADFGMVTPEPEVSEQIKDFVATIKELTVAIGDLTPPLQSLADLFGETGDQAEATGVKVAGDSETWLERASKNVKFWTNVMEGDWDTLWDNYVTAAAEDQRKTAEDQVVWLAGLKQGWTDFFTNWRADIKKESEDRDIWLAEQKTKIGGWLTDIGTAISTFDLGESGRAMMNSLWDGMKGFWDNTLKPWWDSTALGKLADMLPGSEPKDRTSPLAGLQARGRAIVENLQLGIDSANLTLPTPDMGLLAAGAGAGALGPNRTINVYEGAVQIGAGVPSELIPNIETGFRKLLEAILDA